MKSVVKLYELDKYVKAYITVTVEQKNDETIVKFVADEKEIMKTVKGMMIPTIDK